MSVQEYLDDLLNNQLKEIKYRYREKIVADIQNRMCSLLARWDQQGFRRTVLFVTDEEALFYEPEAPDDVKRFVVAAIRNSMLEVAASVNCSRFKMPTPFSDLKIKSITANAIRYFRKCELEALSREAKTLPYLDVYEEAIKKYPLAWAVLKRVAALNGKEEVFEKFPEANNALNFDLEAAGSEETAYKMVTYDGYRLEFDDYLKGKLAEMVSGRLHILYVDCFKALSRNFEKVLHVLEIILQSGGALVTCNYYISNGHIGKRKRILRALHQEEEMMQNMRNPIGLPPFFRDVLKEIG